MIAPWRGGGDRVSDHPNPDLLRSFALGELAAAKADAIAVHLQRGCARCQAGVETYLPADLTLAAGPGRPAATAEPCDPAAAPLDAYDRAIEGALASVRLHGTAAVQVRKRTHQILAELRAGDTPELPPSSPIAPAAQGKSSSQPATGTAAAAPAKPGAPRRFPLYDAALRYSWELRQDDPARMIELARFATRLAPSLGEDGYGPAQVADFEARAWGELANAYRLGDQPAHADEAISAAFGHLARGTGDELVEARLLSLQASVLGSRGHLRAALEVLSRLRKIHLRRGDRHNAGRAMAQAAHYLGYWGLSEVALRTSTEAMAMIDRDVDPAFYLNTLQNYIDLLVDCQRFDAAREQLQEHRSRLLSGQGLLNRLRLKWMEGRIENGVGNLERAARAFVTARRRFLKAGSRRLAALVTLHLASVRIRQGRFGEANPLIEEAIDVLVAIEAAGEALAALKLLRTSHGISQLTAAQVQDAADALRRSNRCDPGGR
jgi:tetratricopeptide (TPR) repeat protein